MIQQGRGNVVTVHDRVAPWVQPDPLGEQLGAHPPTVAGGPIDHEGHRSLHDLAVRVGKWTEWKCGTGSTGDESVSRHGP